MSRFDDIFASVATPVLLEQTGRSVTYHQQHRDDVTLTAIVGPERIAQERAEDGISLPRTRTVIVALAVDGEYGGLAEPAADGEFTIDGVVWAIRERPTISGSMATCECVYAGRAEVSRPGYRKQ